MQSRQIISITGNTSSGKTVLSVKLALALANKGKDVLLVHCDASAPPLAYSGIEKSEHIVSIGEIISASSITQELLLKSCVTTKAPHLCFMGYKAGENYLTYPKYTNARIQEFCTQIRHLADIVIIDCCSDLENKLSSEAIRQANTIIEIVSPGLKGMSWWNSNHMLVNSKKAVNSKQVSVIGYGNGNPELIAQLIGNENLIFPRSEVVSNQYEEEAMINKCDALTTNFFNQLIEKIFEFNETISKKENKSFMKFMRKEKNGDRI